MAAPKMFVRKHWYEVVTASDGTMKLYFERQARGGRGGARWWLFSIREAEESCRPLEPLGFLLKEISKVFSKYAEIRVARDSLCFLSFYTDCIINISAWRNAYDFAQ